MLVRIPTMTPRAWLPAVCDESSVRAGDQKQDRAKFEGGTHAEPGDRQKVRVFIEGQGWMRAVYNRTDCLFWRHFSRHVMINVRGFLVRRPMSGWYEVVGKVLAWTQYPLSGEMADPDVGVAA